MIETIYDCSSFETNSSPEGDEGFYGCYREVKRILL
jgi:hypothetical protein